MHTQKPRLMLFVTILAGALLSLGATDQKSSPNPYLMPDETWVSLSGTVQSVDTDEFMLDYGEGVVTVEMDDGDRDADAYKLLEGDKVTVNGFIDDDFYELTTIEASSVYVEKLDTYFYASGADEEDMVVWFTVPIVPGEAAIQGVVTETDDNSFTVNTGLKAVTVDVSDMPNNPLDDKGYQHIEKGDFVRVTGDIKEEFFTGQKLKAQSIVTLAE